MDTVSVIVILLLAILVLGLLYKTHTLKKKLQALDGKGPSSMIVDPLAEPEHWEPSLAARAAWKLAFSLVTKSLKQQKYESCKTGKNEVETERFCERIVIDMIDTAVATCDVHGGRYRHAGSLARVLDKRRALRRLKALSDAKKLLRQGRRNGQLVAPKEHIATSGGLLRSVRELTALPPPQPQIPWETVPALGGESSEHGRLQAQQHLSLTSGVPGTAEYQHTLAVPGQLVDEDRIGATTAMMAMMGRSAAQSSSNFKSLKPRGVWATTQMSNSACSHLSPMASLVIAMGDPQRGQLGMEPQAAARLISRNALLTLEELRGCFPVQVEASGVASFIVGAKGEVWACGSNRSLELGVRKEIAQVQSAERVKSLHKQRVVQVTGSRSASGQAHTVVLTAEGDVYTFGCSSTGALGHGKDVRQTIPLLLRLGDEVRIRQVAAGARHSVFVTDQGTIYTVGDNRHGQLGHGHRDHANNWSPKFLDIPTIVPGELGTLRVRLLAVGDDHNLAVVEDGRLFSWGANANGQLGIGRTDDQSTPVAVRELQDSNIVSVAAGLRHSIVASDGGLKVWCFGSNVKGQLGLGRSNPADGLQQSSPTLCESMSHKPNKVVQVAAACTHSLALLATGEVWAWGDNSFGQLGFPRAGAGHAMSAAVRSTVQQDSAQRRTKRDPKALDHSRAFAEGVDQIFTPAKVVSLCLWKIRSIATADMHTLALAA